MARGKSFLVAVLVGSLSLLTLPSWADELPGDEVGKAEQKAAGVAEQPAAAEQEGEEVEAQRQWLREQLASVLHSKRQLDAMHARVDKMSPKQIARAVAAQQRKVAKRQQELKQAQLRQERAKVFRDERRLLAAREIGFQRGFRRGYWGGYWDSYRPVGYAPVVTWLPSGTHLSAGGIVSADRRSVRLQAMPFFSNVGPVDTFNFVTGSYRRPEPKQKLEVWYDGLRTRYGVRPDR